MKGRKTVVWNGIDPDHLSFHQVKPVFAKVLYLLSLIHLFFSLILLVNVHLRIEVSRGLRRSICFWGWLLSDTSPFLFPNLEDFSSRVLASGRCGSRYVVSLFTASRLSLLHGLQVNMCDDDLTYFHLSTYFRDWHILLKLSKNAFWR